MKRLIAGSALIISLLLTLNFAFPPRHVPNLASAEPGRGVLFWHVEKYEITWHEPGRISGYRQCEIDGVMLLATSGFLLFGGIFLCCVHDRARRSLSRLFADVKADADRKSSSEPGDGWDVR